MESLRLPAPSFYVEPGSIAGSESVVFEMVNQMSN